MAREKPETWLCDHHYHIPVDTALGGRRVRCLGCGASCPASARAGQAMLALRGEARTGQRLGA